MVQLCWDLSVKVHTGAGGWGSLLECSGVVHKHNTILTRKYTPVCNRTLALKLGRGL